MGEHIQALKQALKFLSTDIQSLAIVNRPPDQRTFYLLNEVHRVIQEAEKEFSSNKPEEEAGTENSDE